MLKQRAGASLRDAGGSRSAASQGSERRCSRKLGNTAGLRRGGFRAEASSSLTSSPAHASRRRWDARPAPWGAVRRRKVHDAHPVRHEAEAGVGITVRAEREVVLTAADDAGVGDRAPAAACAP